MQEKESLIPLGVEPLVNHQAMKVSSADGLKQTEHGAPQLYLSSSLVLCCRNFYEERRDVRLRWS